MIKLKDYMEQSLVDKALEEGGRIEPLIIPVSYTHLTLPTTPYV